MKFAKHIGIMAIALALFAVPGHAAEESAEVAGVPAYSVTRLKIFEGSAWVRTPDSGDWEEFSSNSPVPVRSLVSIPEGSEAELQFHGGQFVLLTSGTEIAILGLEDGKTAFELRAGEIRFYLPETDFAPVSVTAPGEGRAEFSVPGRYWMTATKGGDSTLVVREGEGTVNTESERIPVKAGEQASLGRDVRVSAYTGEGRDSFEEPPPLSETEKQANVPPAAANELRDYGEWVNSSEYGYVWRPRVSQGWSPYYYGRWAWISPYGWTWVSYEPWGWYPYHYGYWYTDPAFGWVWYPFHSFISFSFAWGGYNYPYYHGHSYYYPARVRFVQNGRNVRWVPLRPGERTGRIAYTRSDTRLTSWQRPLSRGTVYVRGTGNQGGNWRDWTVVRRERNASVSTRTTPLRNGARPMVQSGDRGSPGPGGRGADRSTRTQSDRSRNLRETGRPARESPARQERLERIAPSSPRPGRGSGVRAERSNALTQTEKYGNSVRSRVRPSSAVVPSGAGRRSSPGRGEGGSISRGGRAPAAPASGRAIRPQAGPRGQGEQSPRVRSSSPERSRGNTGGPGWSGGFDFGSRGTRGGRSVR
ncbi:MAG: DUF6600 domain-containing protein [Candidatus Deferrimicrobiaceae bacterium]